MLYSYRKGNFEFKEITARSAINESGITDYCINPYAGCQHACKYCYARFVSRFYGKKMSEWGNFVYVKVNLPKLLSFEKRLKRSGEIILSSTTDAYQPLEEKYEITRKVLQELLNEEKFSVVIQTKSNLVLRDIDLIKSFGNRIKVGFTITMDDDMAKIFEPGASSTSSRIEALKKLKESGITTYAFLGPLIPGISNFKWLVEQVYEFSDYIYVDKLNLRPGVWQSLLPTLSMVGKLEEVRKNLESNSFYYKEVKKKVKELNEKYKIEFNIIF
ncbi:MAG: radical SAM protein [Candidatus Brockarchaeota archaeon]|nr:radical SAM protein [Candidatus Brockarchaeota archaeon]MBO3801462.1 radical SAM protein [Candidatus Brockarchaeota archaeon]